jgi:hypothetical protein
MEDELVSRCPVSSMDVVGDQTSNIAMNHHELLIFSSSFQANVFNIE